MNELSNNTIEGSGGDQGAKPRGRKQVSRFDWLLDGSIAQVVLVVAVVTAVFHSFLSLHGPSIV